MQRLATVVPLIDEIGLQSYRDDERGCRSLGYRDGMFVSDLTGVRCDFIPEDGALFTDRATADFERVRRSLADTGVGVDGVDVSDAYEPEAGGNNREITFQLVERTPDEWTYVYEPGYRSPTDAPSGVVEIDDDWFFVARETGIQ